MKLNPEQLLVVIHAQVLAEWALVGQLIHLRVNTDIERHFVWMKRYFGLKYFQSFIMRRVTQFVYLTYIAALAVALAAERCQRPELHRSRSMVLANL